MAMWIGLNETKEMAQMMKERLQVDYTAFHISYFRRRLGFVLDAMGVKRPGLLPDLLLDPEWADQFVGQMVMPVSELFRDPGFWRSLRTLIHSRFPRGSFRVWFPEASTGEEVYSLLILLQQMGRIHDAEVVVQSAGKKLLDEVGTGILSRTQLKVNRGNFERLESNDQFEKYVHEGDKYCEVDARLLQSVVFVHGWVPNCQPIHDADLVLYRNIGLMYSRTLFDQALDGIYRGLSNNGLMALGIQEELNDLVRDALNCINAGENIFGKLGIANGAGGGDGKF